MACSSKVCSNIDGFGVKQLIRVGAYGLIIQNSEILLTLKKAGPYIGRWDFPGGGIEYSETPVQALHRELREEVALEAKELELLTVLSAHGEHSHPEPYFYQYIGIIYRVHNFSPIPDLVPEDEGRWFSLSELSSDEVTPFVCQMFVYI